MKLGRAVAWDAVRGLAWVALWFGVGVAIAFAFGCGPQAPARVPVPPAPIPVVVVPPASVPPPAPIPARHALAWFGSWPCRPSCARETAGWTNLVAVDLGCQDDVTYATGLADLALDNRAIVLQFNGTQYGPTARSDRGYSLRPDAAACWRELLPIVRRYRARIAWIQVFDEPDAVAWGDMVPGGPYNPNLSNDIIGQVCALVHADDPDLPVGLNYSDAVDALEVPGCLAVVGIESYQADWLRRWTALERKTAAAIVALAPAYLDGPGPGNDDATIAARVEAQVEAAQRHQRIAGVWFFLYGWDDLVTGATPFRTIGGGAMPLTRAALERAGRRLLE